MKGIKMDFFFLSLTTITSLDPASIISITFPKSQNTGLDKNEYQFLFINNVYYNEFILDNVVIAILTSMASISTTAATSRVVIIDI